LQLFNYSRDVHGRDVHKLCMQTTHLAYATDVHPCANGARYVRHKKLSCRRGTARRFVSLNIVLSHSSSLKVTGNDTVELGVCKSLLVFHWNYVCMSYRLYIYTTLFAKWQQYKNNIMRHLASKNGVTLELGVEVVQGHWKWRCIIILSLAYGSLIIIVLLVSNVSATFWWGHRYRGVECRGSMKKSRFSTNLALSRKRYKTGPYGTPIGPRMRSIEWHYFQWP